MESPGTAPGSEPRITGAFIAIFPVARNSFNIGAGGPGRKRVEGLKLVYTRLSAVGKNLRFQPGRRQHPDVVQRKARANRLRGPSGRSGLRSAGQKPALMSSNSASIRSRMAVSIGTCGSKVVSIGLMPAASSAA